MYYYIFKHKVCIHVRRLLCTGLIYYFIIETYVGVRSSSNGMNAFHHVYHVKEGYFDIEVFWMCHVVVVCYESHIKDQYIAMQLAGAVLLVAVHGE